MKKQKKRTPQEFQALLQADRQMLKGLDPPLNPSYQPIPQAQRPLTSKPPKAALAVKMKAIRSYVDFNFKNPNRLGAKNKAKITKAFNLIQSAKSQGLAFVKTKSERRKEILNKFSGRHTHKGFKGGWIAGRAIGPKGKVKWKGDSYTIESPDLPDQTFYPIDAISVAQSEDIAETLTKLIADAPDEATFVPVNQESGEMLGYGFEKSKKAAIRLIEKWINQYGTAGESGSKSKGVQHNVDRWLVGIKIIGRA